MSTLTAVNPLVSLDRSALYALAQSADVGAAAAAAREIERRMADSIERYRHAHRALYRSTQALDASGRAVVGTIERTARYQFTAQPIGSTACVPFESHAGALEWLRTLAYLAR